jgi:hypothetical protein
VKAIKIGDEPVQILPKDPQAITAQLLSDSGLEPRLPNQKVEVFLGEKQFHRLVGDGRKRLKPFRCDVGQMASAEKPDQHRKKK